MTKHLFILATTILATQSSAWAQRLYWSESPNNSQILGVDLEGGAISTLIAGLTSPQALALDGIHGQMYWSAESIGGGIYHVDLNGVVVEDLGLDQVISYGIAVDPEAGHLYWTEPFFGLIRRANLDGSDVEEILVRESSPWALTLDLDSGTMFWSDGHDIWKAELDGSDVEHIVEAPQHVFDLAFDPVDDKIYWTDRFDIWRQQINASAGQRVVTGQDQARGLALDPQARKIYWGSGLGISRADLDGGHAELLYALPAENRTAVVLDLRECSGHGSRIKGQCACDPGWEGENCGCSTAACPEDCSGLGQCICGSCACDPGWTGSACDCSTGCPGDCSGNGVCDCGVCVCDPMFEGDNCACFTGGCLNDCSGQGICDCGTCICDPGWDGPDCSCEPQKCPNDCSGHGTCVCGVCDCDPGWYGPDCAQALPFPARLFMVPDGLQEQAAPGTNVYLTPAGTTVRMMVWLEDTSDNGWPVNAYQLMFQWSAHPQFGAKGTIQYVDEFPGQPGGRSMFLDVEREDWLFADLPALASVSYNESPQLDLFGVFYATVLGLFVDPAQMPGIQYLCEFDLEISPDAAGSFEFRFNVDNALGTTLFDSFGGSYSDVDFQPLRVVVGASQPLNSEPPHGAIDPRMPAGESELHITFNGPTAGDTPLDYAIEVSGGITPQIIAIEADGQQVTLRFDGPFPPGECTTVRHVASGWFTTMRALPGDVNGNGVSSPKDIIALVDQLNGLSDPPLKSWQCDINRSGVCEPWDILTLIDLLNGAGGATAWNGAAAPQCP